MNQSDHSSVVEKWLRNALTAENNLAATAALIKARELWAGQGADLDSWQIPVAFVAYQKAQSGEEEPARLLLKAIGSDVCSTPASPEAFAKSIKYANGRDMKRACGLRHAVDFRGARDEALGLVEDAKVKFRRALTAQKAADVIRQYRMALASLTIAYAIQDQSQELVQWLRNGMQAESPDASIAAYIKALTFASGMEKVSPNIQKIVVAVRTLAYRAYHKANEGVDPTDDLIAAMIMQREYLLLSSEILSQAEVLEFEERGREEAMRVYDEALDLESFQTTEIENILQRMRELRELYEQ